MVVTGDPDDMCGGELALVSFAKGYENADEPSRSVEEVEVEVGVGVEDEIGMGVDAELFG